MKTFANDEDLTVYLGKTFAVHAVSKLFLDFDQASISW
jgi:hypothetical protein